MLVHTSTPSKLEWLLVRNWAASGQTLFESRVEARSFLSCLARAVRAGQLEIHAYCLLTREFHMLVRAVGGILAIALRSACSRYEQWLQRTRGTVRQYFRGHCARTPIHDTETRKDAIRFIESWPLHASAAADPGLYPFATAYMMRGLSPRPAWLSTHWIEGELGHRFGDPRFVDKYREHFIGASMLSGRRRIEARLSHETRGCSIADHLQHGDRHCVAAWLRTRAEEGLSAPSKWTICTPEAVDGVIQAVSSKGTRDSNSMRVAFLRILSGLSWDGIAQRMRHEEDWVLRMYQEHCARVLRDDQYLTLLVSIACAIPRVAENGGFPIPQSQLIPLDSLKLRDTQMHSEFIAHLPWKPLLRRRS